MKLQIFCVALTGLLGVACGSDSSGSAVECGAGTIEQDGLCVPESDVGCGTGTTLVGGECVPEGLTECGIGTVLMDGECVPDIAGCGPGTQLESGNCVIDESAPGPVTGLTAVENGSNIDLSWTAPAGASGVIVARLDNGSTAAPQRFTEYAVDDVLPGGATVLFVGTDSTLSDASTAPGRHTYMAWAFNDSEVYGFGRSALANVSLPAQTGQIVIDVAAGTATVATQPSDISLTATFGTFNASEATFELGGSNDTAGTIVNPKVIVTGQSVGDINNQGTVDGSPFLRLGFGNVLRGALAPQTVTLTGLAADDIVTLDVVVDQGVLAITGNEALDLDGGESVPLNIPTLRGWGMSRPVFTNGFFGPTSRYFYGVLRWTASLYRVDTANGDTTRVQAARFDFGSGQCAFLGDDGFAYVAISLGAHHGTSSGSPESLVVSKIDIDSMTVVDTVEEPIEANLRAFRCAVHNNTIALPIEGSVYLFDTSTFAFVDTDGAAAGVNPIALDAVTDAREAAFNADGSLLYIGDRDGNIDEITLATNTAVEFSSTLSGGAGLRVDSAGVLWYGGWARGSGGTGIFSFDGATETSLAGYTRGNVRTLLEITATTLQVVFDSGFELVTFSDGSATNTGTMRTDIGNASDGARPGHAGVVLRD